MAEKVDLNKYKRKNQTKVDLNKYRRHKVDESAVKDGTIDKYGKHIPTWGDRAKEVGQGLAGFAGGTIDMGNDIANLFPGKEVHSNYGDEWKNLEALKTKNKDLTSSMLRGVGEYGPEILPFAAGGKAIARANRMATLAGKKSAKKKAAEKGVKVRSVQPTSKTRGRNALTELLNTPITPTNVGAFAGAGGALGALHQPDNEGKVADQPWYKDLGAAVGGSLAGAGATSLAGGGASLVGSAAKGAKRMLTGAHKQGNDLGIFERYLANKIDNSPNRELDQAFIDAAEQSRINRTLDETTGKVVEKAVPGVDLNALNIYKNNKVPYDIASTLKNEKFGDVVSNIEKGTDARISNILDENLGLFNPESSSETAADNLSKILNDVYNNLHTKSTQNFNNVEALITPGDLANPSQTVDAAREVFEKTAFSPGGKGTSGEKVSNIAQDIMLKLSDDEVKLQQLQNARTSINEQIREHGKGSPKFKLLDTIKGEIDRDIERAVIKGKVANPDLYDEHVGAVNFFRDQLGPFRNSKVFNSLMDDSISGVPRYDAGANVQKALKSKAGSRDLEHLVNNTKVDGRAVNKEAVDQMNAINRHTLEGELGANKSDTDILRFIDNSRENPIFTSKLNFQGNETPRLLKADVSPLLEKKIKVAKGLKESGAENVPKYEFDWSHFKPKLGGAMTGFAMHQSPLSTILGGLGAGALAGGNRFARNKLSERTVKAFDNEAFVKELIRRAAVEKEELVKLNMLQKLISGHPASTYQAGVAPFRNDESFIGEPK